MIATAEYRIKGEGAERYNPEVGKVERPPDVTVKRLTTYYEMPTKRKTEVFGRQDVKGLVMYHAGTLLNAHSVVLDGVVYLVQNRRQLRNRATYEAYSEF